jgi:hypothetical protein
LGGVMESQPHTEPRDARRLRVHRWLVLLLVLAPPVAFVALTPPVGDWTLVAFLVWVPIAALLWVSYLGARCPRCGNAFFINRNTRVPPILQLRWAANPFRSNCANCGLPISSSNS